MWRLWASPGVSVSRPLRHVTPFLLGVIVVLLLTRGHYVHQLWLTSSAEDCMQDARRTVLGVLESGLLREGDTGAAVSGAEPPPTTPPPQKDESTVMKVAEEATATDSPSTRQKLVILLHTSLATWHTRAQAVKDTLLADPLPPGVRLVWVANEHLPTEELQLRTSNRRRPALTEEPIGAMNERVLQAFAKAAKEHPADYYLKMDDDTYANFTNVLKVAESLPNPTAEVHYAGCCSCKFRSGIAWCRDKPEMRSYFNNCSGYDGHDQELKDGRGYNCGGPGYLLSQAALLKLLAHEEKVGLVRSYEDIMVGWAMAFDLHVRCHDLRSLFWDRITSVESSEHPTSQWECSHLATYHKALPHVMRLMRTCAVTGECARLGNLTYQERGVIPFDMDS